MINRGLCVITVLSLLLSATAVYGATLEDGWTAYDAGQYDLAYDIFSTLFRTHPESEKVNFALGMSALAKGRLSHALFAFERVLMMNPENHRARLELARTYTAMGLYDLARTEFQQVIDVSPPETVTRNIEQYLKYIDDQTDIWGFNAQVVLSAFHDDNVNYGPSSHYISTIIGVLEVATNSEPKASPGLSLGLSGEVTCDIGAHDHWLIRAGAVAYQNSLRDASESETAYAGGEIALRRLSPRTLFDLPLKFDHLEVGHDRFLLIAGIEPSLLFASSAHWQYISKLYLQHREYRDGDTRDGPYFRFDQTVRRFFDEGRYNMSLTAAYYYEDARVNANDNHGMDLILSGEAGLLKRTWLYGLSEYRTATYRGKVLEDLQETDRRDYQLQFVAGLRQEINDRIGLNLNYRYVRNSSNFGLYEYDRNIFALSTYVFF